MTYRDATATLLDRIETLERARLPARARWNRLMRARRDRRRAALRKLARLVLVTIVPAVLGAAVVTLLVQPGFRRSCLDKERASLVSAHALQQVSELWLADHRACPTTEVLMNGGYVDRTAKLTDAWNGAYVITCEGDDVEVRSPGPDAVLGNADDIRTPR